MTCQAIEKLLPLYVEEDLRPRQMERVRAHVSGCPLCLKSVADLRASQRWLRERAVAPITGEALDRMRAAVARRIDATPPRPAFWLGIERGWALLRQWAAQPAVSVAAVFVVVLGSVAISQVVGPRGSHGTGAAGVLPASELVGPIGIGDGEDVLEGRDENAASSGESELPRDDQLLAQASTEDLAEGRREPAAAGNAAAGGPVDDDMRIEIQTRDPNVRIIWFTPQDGN